MTIGPEANDSQFEFGLPPLELIENAAVPHCKNGQSSLGIGQSASENYAPANPHPPDTPPDSPEPEEELQRKRDNIARMEANIHRGNDNNARADSISEFFQKYPQANYSFVAVLDLYSDRSLQELVIRIEEENIHEGDPMKRFVLLYNFFKGRQELEKDVEILMDSLIDRIAAGERIV